MKISVIGVGAMGAGLISGLLESGEFAPENIIGSTPHPEKQSGLISRGVKIINDNIGAVSDSDLIVLAVKPWILTDVVSEIAPHINGGQEVTAIVAGISSEELAGMFGNHCPDNLSISMPNTALSVMESMTFLVDVRGNSALAETVFSKLGKVMAIPERLFPAATALASCGIAFAMRYVRAACEGGVELGFRAREAQEIMTQVLKGVATLLEQDGSHPETEIDKVTTPGGITIRGLNAMERYGFTTAVIEGHKATCK